LVRSDTSECGCRIGRYRLGKLAEAPKRRTYLTLAAMLLLCYAAAEARLRAGHSGSLVRGETYASGCRFGASSRSLRR
jgi:hypothetical protein